MRNSLKIPRVFPLLALFIALALTLSACGAVPANSFAGLSSDGKLLYVANQSFIFAVDSGSGSIQWQYPQKADQNVVFYAPPAVANGWVYAGDYKNVLFAFKLEGLDPVNPVPSWTFETHKDKGRIIGSPLVVGDTVVVSSSDSHVYALGTTSNTLKWTFTARNSLWSSPVSDGKLVFQAGMDHYLYAIDLASGTKKWEIDLGGPISAGLTLGPDGILYTGTLSSELIAVDTGAGKLLWRKKIDGSIWSAPLLHENTLYFGTDKNKVYLVSVPEGAIEKTVDAGGVVMAAPVYTKDAVVIVTEAGDVFSLTLDGSNKPWTRKVSKGMLYSTPIVLNEQIILATFQGDHLLAGFGFTGTPDEKWNSVAPK